MCHPRRPRLQGIRCPLRLADVVDEDNGGEAVGCVVGVIHGFSELVERDGRDQQRKDILPYHLYIVVRNCEDGWGDKVATTESALESIAVRPPLLERLGELTVGVGVGGQPSPLPRAETPRRSTTSSWIERSTNSREPALQI